MIITSSTGNIITTVAGNIIYKDIYAPVDGNEFIWNALTYKVVVRDYGASKLAWLDRNMGATQVATSSTDAASYGDLYQWGRLTDGHQIRTSGTTATLSATDVPGHGDFITISSGNLDWRDPQNINLWQSASDSPCPTGWRLPTNAELETERLSWISNNSAGAFASPLKLPMAGYRYSNGLLYSVGSDGYYWSSTVVGLYSRVLYFYSTGAFMGSSRRANGYSIRCVRDI